MYVELHKKMSLQKIMKNQNGMNFQMVVRKKSKNKCRRQMHVYWCWVAHLLVEYNIGHKSELDVSRINSSQGLLVETNLVFLLNQSTFEMKNLSLPIDSSRFQLFSNHIGERSTCTSKTISTNRFY